MVVGTRPRRLLPGRTTRSRRKSEALASDQLPHLSRRAPLSRPCRWIRDRRQTVLRCTGREKVGNQLPEGGTKAVLLRVTERSLDEGTDFEIRAGTVVAV